MNKQKFVDYLRSPERLTEGQFEELQKLLTDYPYFSIAKSIAARGAKDLELESKSQFISSAAIYATDRKHLKKYINGELVFLVDPPKIDDEIQSTDTGTSQVSNESSRDVIDNADSGSEDSPSSILDEIPTHVPTGDEVDQILDELQRDIKELEKSRMHFLEVQDHIDEAKFTSKETPENKKTSRSEDLTKENETSVTKEEPNEPITEPLAEKEPMKEAEKYKKIKDKFKDHFSENPAK